MLGRVLLHFKSANASHVQQVVGKPLVDRCFPFVFQFTCGEVTEEMPFHQDGLPFQPFG